MIPYPEITDTSDRRWTVRLLSRLSESDAGEGELGELAAALRSLSDVRSFVPLEAVLCDTNRPDPVREAASAALRGMQHVAVDTPSATLRRWWHEGDAVLRKHALLCMDGDSCPDIVAAVAADETHPLQEDALARMIWDFDLPGYEAVKIAALSHPRPEIRAAAADVLFWDEPVAAEGKLLEATRDPYPKVAEEAAHTLCYYPSVRGILCLHGMFDHLDRAVRERARESFQSLREQVLDQLRGANDRVASRLRSWLRPVRDLLDYSDEELRPADESSGPTDFPAKAAQATLPMEDVLAHLTDPDVSPCVLSRRLRHSGWAGYTAGERRRLRPVLLAHADPFVRDLATGAFEAWYDAAGLLELVQDDSFLVRKSAMFSLGNLRPVPEIGEFAWAWLCQPGTSGTHALETLKTFVRHAPAEVAAGRLFDLAADAGAREGIRAGAVHHLRRLKARHEVAGLSGLVTRPPAVNWELHLAVFEATKELSLPSLPVGHLREVDNLYIQEAIAELDA
jgi:HEAT repeat protein